MTTITGSTIDGRDLSADGTKLDGMYAPTAAGVVGTYAWLGRAASATFVAGTTYAGSDLKYAGSLSTNAYNDNTAMHIGGATPSGTWRAMGSATIAGRYPATLFIRIA